MRRRRAAAADVVVACLGDSITKGADDLNYPLLMQRDELGDAWRVANYGVSGASLKRGETGVGKPFVDEPEYATFTDDGADSEQNQQWVFTCPAEGDCGNQV